MIPARFKNLVIMGLAIVFVAMGLYVLYQTSRPKLIITFDETFDPLQSTVLLDDNLITPSGKNGQTYKTTASAGNHALRVYGPMITPIDEQISLSFFSTKTIDKKLTPLSIEEITRTTLKQSEIVVQNGKFYDSVWLVVEASNFPYANKDGYTAWPVFLHYDRVNNTWEDVNAVGAELYDTAPFAARRDYEELADD